MNPWWSPEWINHWGPPLFHAIFWPLTVLGGPWSPRHAAQSPRRARISLCIGITLGAILIGTGAVALGLGQPGSVWGQLALFGGILITVHAAILIAMERARRTASQKGVIP